MNQFLLALLEQQLRAAQARPGDMVLAKAAAADPDLVLGDAVELGEVVKADAAGKLVAPERFRIWPKGQVSTRTLGEFLFDEEAANQVMADFMENGQADLPLDYDHAMFSFFSPVEDKRAAGWFTPQVIGGELWATGITWTDRGRQAVESREWRYFSPAYKAPRTEAHDKDPKLPRRITKLFNVALTNVPNTKRLQPLVAALGADQEEAAMLKFILAALGLKEDATEADVQRALANLTKAGTSGELDGDWKALASLTGKASKVEILAAVQESKKAEVELAAQVAQAAKEKAEQEIAALVAKGITEKKITPALEPWARQQTKANLEAFLAATGSQVPTKAHQEPKSDEEDGVAGLNEMDLKIASMMGTNLKVLAQVKKEAPGREAQLSIFEKAKREIERDEREDKNQGAAA